MTSDPIPDPEAGTCVPLADGVSRLLAPNPSPMTYLGTNTYLLGHDSLAIIDPGPASDRHFAALIRAIGGRRVSHILVTHSHLDHSPLARPLALATGALVMGFGGVTAGRSARMAALAAGGLAGGGEGIDHAFEPDITLADGDQIDGDGWHLSVLHTPGHLGNHICLDMGDAVFTGDQVMGWATSLVSPPDGDLSDYLASCRRLVALGPRELWPGHGGAVSDSLSRINWILQHRADREEQILTTLSQCPGTVAGIAAQVYADLAPGLWPAAKRNVFAHLVDLETRNLVKATPTIGINARFERV